MQDSGIYLYATCGFPAGRYIQNHLNEFAEQFCRRMNNPNQRKSAPLQGRTFVFS
jgi:hypothetical protein